MNSTASMKTDSIFATATEQNTVRKKNRNTTVIVHVVNHVFDKREICFAGRCKFSRTTETRIVKEGRRGRPFCRIRRICDLNGEFRRSEVVFFKRIIVEQIVGEKLIQYDMLAVNTIVKIKSGEVSSCDISQTDSLDRFNTEYLKYTAQVAESCMDRDLSENSMVIGTSAIINTEIDGTVGMNSGIFNNPFIIWGKYRKKFPRYYLPISFQFHHTQMDGAHAGKFLANMQNEIDRLR